MSKKKSSINEDFCNDQPFMDPRDRENAEVCRGIYTDPENPYINFPDYIEANNFGYTLAYRDFSGYYSEITGDKNNPADSQYINLMAFRQGFKDGLYDAANERAYILEMQEKDESERLLEQQWNTLFTYLMLTYFLNQKK